VHRPIGDDGDVQLLAASAHGRAAHKTARIRRLQLRVVDELGYGGTGLQPQIWEGRDDQGIGPASCRVHRLQTGNDISKMGQPHAGATCGWA
jgi:hypothetical protein